VINPNLYKKPVAVDSVKHRDTKLAHPVRDWAAASDVNAMFIATAEFGDACAEYPIVFVDAGKDETSGKQQIAPIAVFGLSDKQNLYAEAGRWRAHYMPALLRAYPFGIARQDEQRVVIVMEEGFAGWSQTEGQPLFDAEGKPTEFMNGMREQLERLETEIQRTRLFGNLMVDADLLQPMRFDATLPDGQTISVDGFLTVDETKLAALSDAKILEFHKNGVMGLIHAHQISLRHMRRLVDWHLQRLQGTKA
jgi:SapC